jgi:DNA-binding FrmR family transcriptional regulator
MQCLDVLIQLASVQEALRGITKLMMRNYLENCATKAIRSKSNDAVYDELMDVIFKFAK